MENIIVIIGKLQKGYIIGLIIYKKEFVRVINITLILLPFINSELL